MLTLNINKVGVAASALILNKVLPLRLSEAGEEIGRAEIVRLSARPRQQPEEEEIRNEVFFEM